MDAKNTYSPDKFVPVEVMDWIGGERKPACIKMEPEDFIVEERQAPDRLCTVSTTTDIDESAAWASGKPGMVAVTLVKRKLTSKAAVYQLAQRLGVSSNRVSTAGLKDRWAVSSQEVRIEGVHIDDVVRNCCPDKLYGTGWFIKDARPAKRRLNNGQLLTNRFTLNVAVPGLSAAQIEAYIKPRLEQLASRGWLFPNAYGRQRLGRRQNLYQIGETLMREGVEAGIKRFLTETAPGNERDAATKLRQQLAGQWYWFQNMKRILEEPMDRGTPAYQALNMDMEHKIVCRMLQYGSFSQVMDSMRDEFSLWVGAYQGYWFNQILARVIRKEIVLEGGAIPLLVFDQKWDDKRRQFTDEDGEAISFYRKYCPEAIPDHVDPEVKSLFLTPRENGRGHVSAPWRRALIPVVELKQTFDNGFWRPQFELRSGGYATTLLGLLFDIDQDEDHAASEQVRRDRPRHPRGNHVHRHGKR
jgi:TruD family tRNA pseudouridine synthase